MFSGLVLLATQSVSHLEWSIMTACYTQMALPLIAGLGLDTNKGACLHIVLGS